MPTVVHVCSDVYSSEVPAGTRPTSSRSLRVCHFFALSFAALGLSRQSHQQKQEYRWSLFHVLHHWLPLEAWFLNFLMASKHMISQKASQQEWSEWTGGWLRRRPRLRCKGEDPFSKLANWQWVYCLFVCVPQKLGWGVMASNGTCWLMQPIRGGGESQLRSV